MPARSILVAALIGPALAMAPPAAAQQRVVAPFLEAGVSPAEPPPRTALEAVPLVVGERYPGAHLVTAPGRYGVSEPPPGETYAVVGNKLVRLDRTSFKLLSVLRVVVDIVD